MPVDESGAVTIYNRGRPAMVADDQGLTVLAARNRDRRLAWSEISYFADGSHSEGQWVLDIVLRAGPTISVASTSGRPGDPETLKAIRQMAERYGIAEDLTGVRMMNGLPPDPGLYEDPGGHTGLRYWDGTQWSPLLPRAAARWGALGGLSHVRDSAPAWVDLPVAAEPWDYPAGEAARAKAWVWRLGLATSAAAAAGLVTGLWSGNWSYAGIWFLFDGFPALFLYGAWVNWYPWRKLERWVRTSDSTSSKQWE